jgi:tRNA (adenine57-N1/adenine58-N1)-methyltransferase
MFLERCEVIKENDVIIAYVSPADMKPLTCIKDGVFRNRYGEFCHNGMIGKRFGVKYPSKNSHGFIYLLYPTPELWTLVLPHRTQILYNADISLITMLLELKPGSKMIEAGTGSGSFSHAIARTIYPNGKLFTFEYHQDRQKIAEQEFKEHCLDSIIVCSFGDVCRNGFGDIEPVDCGK